ncbi:MAG: serine hydrolase [Candidatus Promineifilaceae bacterium]
MIRSIRKWFIILLLLAAGIFLGIQGFKYRTASSIFPEGTTIAGLDVSGLDDDEAKQLIQESYGSPIFIYHEVEHVELDPEEIGFTIRTDQMIEEAKFLIGEHSEWLRFVSFVLKRPLDPVDIPLIADHDPDAVESLVQSMAELLDEPATAAQMLSGGSEVREGEAGYITDVPASLPVVADALYRPENRVAKLAMIRQESPEMSMDLLKQTIQAQLQGFNGLGSVFVLDLQTGEEIGINADVAMSGLSILKIAIFVEAFRAIDGPLDAETERLFMDTATRSSNYGANLLLHVVAGEDNTYEGADLLTESMRHLGLENTFMAVPYDATPPGYRQTTYVTPANSRNDQEVDLDETMQSTAEEIGTLLSMIYQCSKGGGALLALYPDELTPSECQYIIDLMILNEEGNLIRFGVPDGVPVSHKHGWAQGTHADAGIVFSPGGDFVLVEYLHQPGSWLVADVSFPILREIARATYNYFNMDDPYLPAAVAAREEINASDPFSEFHQENNVVTEQENDSEPTDAAGESPAVEGSG